MNERFQHNGVEGYNQGMVVLASGSFMFMKMVKMLVKLMMDQGKEMIWMKTFKSF